MARRPKMTEAEKACRKAERKAKQMTALDLKSLGGPGSMFADLVRTWTPEEAARHQVLCRMTDGMPHTMIDPGNLGVEMIHVAALERVAEQHLGAEATALLRARIRKTYPVSYWGMMWRDLLTGRSRMATRIDLCCVTVPTRIVESGVCPPADWQPLTIADLPQAPNHMPREPVTDDDPDGVFPRVMAALA